MITIPICPHCGDNDSGFWTKSQMHGPAETYYGQSGEYEEMSTDKMYTTESGTVRCGKCLKIRRDLTVKDNRIVSK